MGQELQMASYGLKDIMGQKLQPVEIILDGPDEATGLNSDRP